MNNLKLLFCLVVLFTSCSDDDSGDDLSQSMENPPEVTGTNYSKSANSLNNTYNSFLSALNSNDAISVVAELDHAENASAVGLNLNPTQIVFFGNPTLGTPLMQQNQLAGLDLPQKVLFYQTEDNDVYALYNNVAYLSSRHGLDGVSTLDQIAMALQNLTSNATGNEVESVSNLEVEMGEGIITKESAQDFSTTYSALRNAISSNANLTIVAELDHQANAASVDMELRPTKIIIFGNPNLGTPLMQSEQTAGLDLPQKMLVWEDAAGMVNISYNDARFIAERHNLEGVEMEVETINMALDNLSNAAAGN